MDLRMTTVNRVKHSTEIPKARRRRDYFWRLLWGTKTPGRGRVDRDLARLGVAGGLALLLNDGELLTDVASWRRGGGGASFRGDRPIRRKAETQEQILSFVHLLTRLRAKASGGWPMQDTGTSLRRWFGKRGWRGLLMSLIWKNSIFDSPERQLRELWKLALTEALLFERSGFSVRRCEHGKHWYVGFRGDRLYCPVHQRAGWQAAWRKGEKERERTEAAQRTRAIQRQTGR